MRTTYDERGYSLAGNAQRARYKFALSRALAREAKQEAQAIENAKERGAWLAIARESRQDAHRWLQALRVANEAMQCA